MNDSDLFQITVPVFQHYLSRMRVIVSGLSEIQAPLIDVRLAPHAFSAAEHLQTALGFVSRTIFPLIGEKVPEPGSEEPSIRDLLKLIDEVDSRVLHIEPDRFNGAAERIIRHTAGDACLEQGSVVYVTIFALPNFFFHLTSAYSILRHAGVELGKADFDGFHRYKPGFHF